MFTEDFAALPAGTRVLCERARHFGGSSEYLLDFEIVGTNHRGNVLARPVGSREKPLEFRSGGWGAGKNGAMLYLATPERLAQREEDRQRGEALRAISRVEWRNLSTAQLVAVAAVLAQTQRAKPPGAATIRHCRLARDAEGKERLEVHVRLPDGREEVRVFDPEHLPQGMSITSA